MKFLEPIFSETLALSAFLVICPAGAAVAVALAAGVDDDELSSLPQAASPIAATAARMRLVSDLMGRSGSSSW